MLSGINAATRATQMYYWDIEIGFGGVEKPTTCNLAVGGREIQRNAHNLDIIPAKFLSEE